ncbi:MAG: glycoside hydrolase family 6 protein [Polyangiaceae bacterium]|nr:glycoside hydrolase family 6 protein [Polyangiaceae bacterium]
MKKQYFTRATYWLAPLALTCSLGASLACGGSSGAKSAKAAKAQRPDPQAPLVEPPIPAPVTTNPLQGAKLFVDPQSLAMLQANNLRRTDAAQAAVVDRIAQQPQGLWMGEWNSDIFRAVQYFVERAVKDGSVPVIIAYNVPHRDAAAEGADAGHSAGGLDSKEAYMRWIRDVYAGIGDNAAVVILEPDALPGLKSMPEDWQKERLYLLNDAIRTLRQNPKVAVYIDAGHAAWVPAEEMAEMLKGAGVEYASGFSLNTSNYRTTEECLEYGHQLSELTGGKHFVIDTSRNGAGPYLEAKNEEETWCNPPGRKIGQAPTTQTGDAVVDAYLWLKRPGESDGECNGGPKAGVWWMDQAIQMASP